MWTIKEVEKFIRENPINTGGAINAYKHSKVKTIDDGDIHYRVRFPFWSNNNYVAKDLISLVQKALDKGDISVYCERSCMRICFHNHFCDPD